jgi:hypothetical protein
MAPRVTEVCDPQSVSSLSLGGPPLVSDGAAQITTLCGMTA